jgi:hypothetical protein
MVLMMGPDQAWNKVQRRGQDTSQVLEGASESSILSPKHVAGSLRLPWGRWAHGKGGVERLRCIRGVADASEVFKAYGRLGFDIPNTVHALST